MSFSFPQAGHAVGIWLKSFSEVPVLVTGEFLSSWWGWGWGSVAKMSFRFPAQDLAHYSFLNGIKITTFPS